MSGCGIGGLVGLLLADMGAWRLRVHKADTVLCCAGVQRLATHRVACAPWVPSGQYAPSASRYTLYSTSPRIMPWLTRR